MANCEKKNKFCMRPWKKNNLTFTLKKQTYFIAQGVKKYFHDIYIKESVKKNIVLDEKNITII